MNYFAMYSELIYHFFKSLGIFLKENNMLHNAPDVFLQKITIV